MIADTVYCPEINKPVGVVASSKTIEYADEVWPATDPIVEIMANDVSAEAPGVGIASFIQRHYVP